MIVFFVTDRLTAGSNGIGSHRLGEAVQKDIAIAVDVTVRTAGGCTQVINVCSADVETAVDGVDFRDRAFVTPQAVPSL